MSRKIFAVTLIVFASASWLYLDYMNKQEILAINEMRKEMQMSHERVVANYKVLAEYNSQFETANVNDLTVCYSEAEKANFNYISHLQKPGNNKKDTITIDKADLTKAAALLESDKERCKNIYDSKFKVKDSVQ